MVIEWSAFAWLAAVTTGAGLLSALVVYAATRPIVTDIERLAAAARRVAAGDFDVRVDVSSPVELAVLAQAFNSMAAEVRSLFEQQRHSERARRDLVANVTHDLRTPLTATAAMVQALRDGVAPEEDRERYLRTIAQELNYMARLITDLSDLLQLESGQIRIKPIRLNCDDVLAEVLEAFGVAMQQKRASFHVHIAPDCREIVADPIRLRQALTNIVQNAVTYTPEGGTVAIRVTPNTGSRRFVRVSVEDQGPGMPADVAKRAFERFYRGDAARSRAVAGTGAAAGTADGAADSVRTGGGMGLGLAIAKDIVERHDGRIGVESRTTSDQGGQGPKRKGTAVWFDLPAS